MMKRTIALSIATCLIAVGSAAADRLSTAGPNNGRSDAGAGIFVDLTADSGQISISEIGMVSSTSQGTPVRLRVWRRTGSYVGFDGTSDGWSVVDQVDAISVGNADPTPFILNNPITLDQGQVTGFLFEGEIGGVRYTGTSGVPPQTTWTDSNMTLFSDVARGGPPFSGSRFTPRCFSGYIEYEVGPGSYRIRISGTCPGTVTINWDNTTPNRQQGILFASSQGNFVIPGGICAGTELGLSNQNLRLVNTLGTGANGSGSVNGQAGTSACGGFIQFVEAPSCQTSNVVQVP